LIAALTWPIDVAQELKEMADGPAVVTDYASLLRAQQEYKVGYYTSSLVCVPSDSCIGDVASDERTSPMSVDAHVALSRQYSKGGKRRASHLARSTYRQKYVIDKGRSGYKYNNRTEGGDVETPGQSYFVQTIRPYTKTD
jgi:hypothetical protein